MIQNSQLMNTIKTQLETANLSEANLKLLAAKCRELLIEGLEIGDILEGIITPNGEGKYTLDIKPGIHIPVSLLSDVEIGKLIKLIVENKQDGQLVLSMLKEEVATNLNDLVTKQFELPRDTVMKDCVNSFIENQLPLKKETLMQAYYLQKNYQMPAEVVSKLFNEYGILPNQMMESIETLKTNGIYPIQQEIGQIIEQIENPEQLMKVFASICEGATEEQIGSVLKDISKKQILLTGESDNDGFFSAKDLVLPKKMENILLDKDLGKIFQTLLSRPESLKDVVVKLYDTTTLTNLNEIKNGDTIKKETFETYNKLARIINTLEELPLKETAKTYISDIKQPIALLGTMNQVGDYFLFPTWQQQLQDAEVYFFRPKKSKKDESNELYTVVALDLPQLEHIEVHVRQIGKQLSMGFNVKNEAIKKFVMIHVPRLQTTLEDMGYKVLQCSYQVIEEATKQKLLLKDEQPKIINHVDFRA